MTDYNLGTASGRIEINGRGAQAGFKVAETAAGAFFDVVKSRVSDVQKLGRRMAAVGTGGVAGFGLAIKSASSFEKQMSGVYAVANANTEEMGRLKDAALRIGQDTQYSASEAAGALEEIIKAGISVEDALNGAADATVALAAAGGLSLPEAATIAANAMNSFELSSKEMPKIADILAGVANTSAADVSEIGQSMQQASAVAHLAGLSFEDTAIAIGEMADAGIKGSDAGTSIKTMLNNLIPTTEKQQGLFEDLGLITYDLAKANKTLAKEGLKPVDSIDKAKASLTDYIDEIGRGKKGTARNRAEVAKLLQANDAMHNSFFDAKGDVKGLAGLQGELAKALKGQTREQKLSNLETLFGADAMRASAIMTLEGKKGYEDFAGAVHKTKAADVAKTRMDNLSGAVESFKGSLETAQITIGSIFLPIITKMVKAGTWVLNLFNSLPNAVKTAIGVLIGFLSIGSLVIGLLLAFAPVLLAMIGHFLMMRAIGAVTGGIFKFFRVLRAGNGVMAATRAAAALTGGELTTLGKRSLFAGKMSLLAGKMFRGLWLAITGPIGIVIGVIIALAAIGYLLYKKWKPFHDLVDRIGAAIRDKFLKAMKSLKPVFDNVQKIIGRVVGVFNKVKDAIANLFGGGNSNKKATDFAIVLDNIFGNTGKLVQPLFKLASFLLKVRDGFKPAMAAAAAFAGMLAGKAFGAIKEFIGFVVATMLPVLRKIGGDLWGKITKGVHEISDALGGLIGPSKDLGSSFSANVIPVIQKVLSYIPPIVSAIMKWANAVGKILIPIVYGLGRAFVLYVLPILAKVVGFLMGVVIGAVVDLVKGIIQSVKGIIQIFTGLIDFFTGLFTGNWSKMWSGLLTVMKGILNLIVGAIKVWMNIGLLKIVGLGFKAILAIVKGSWRGIFAVFKGAGKGIWATTKFLFRTLLRIITAPFRLYVAVIRGAWNLIGRIFTNAGPRIINTVRGFFIRLLRFWWTNGQSLIRFARQIIDRVWQRFTTGLGRIIGAFRDYFSRIIGFVRNIPHRILNALGNLGDLLYNAGGRLIHGLLQGIKDKLPDIGGAMGAVGDKIKGFLPGSPVKEGPLTSWNRGAAGKRLVGMLAKGLEDPRPVEESMKAVAGYINAAQSMIRPLDLTSVVAAVPSSLAVSATHAIAGTGTQPKAKAAPASTTKVLNQTNNIHNPKPEKAGKSQARVMRDKVEEAGW